MKRFRVLIVLLAGAATAAAGLAPAAGAAPVDAIRIAGPGPIARGAVYDLTVSGVAHRRAVAYVFVDYAGCLLTLAAELRRARHAYDSYPVVGSFAEVSGWKSSSGGTDHACAYLVTRRGTPLATARIKFEIR